MSAITETSTTWTRKNKIGLGLAIFYNVTNIPSVLVPPTDTDEPGPPMAILVVCSVLGLVGTIAAIIAWRKRNRSAARLAAASAIIITLTSLPAFFVDVPAAVKILVAVGVVLTVALVVLIFSKPKGATA